jgi:hypothetical protein
LSAALAFAVAFAVAVAFVVAFAFASAFVLALALALAFALAIGIITKEPRVHHEWEGHEFHSCRQVAERQWALKRLRYASSLCHDSFRSVFTRAVRTFRIWFYSGFRPNPAPLQINSDRFTPPPWTFPPTRRNIAILPR